jgi:hypothetical protein
MNHNNNSDFHIPLYLRKQQGYAKIPHGVIVILQTNSLPAWMVIFPKKRLHIIGPSLHFFPIKKKKQIKNPSSSFIP